MFEKLGSQKGETFSEKIVIKQKRLNNLTLLLMGYFLPLYLRVVGGGGGVEYVHPIFICENNRKSKCLNKKLHDKI